MRGIYITWAIFLSLVGMTMVMTSDHPKLRAKLRVIFSQDPLINLSKQATLNKFERETLASAVFNAFQNPASEGSISVQQRQIEARQGLEHLMALSLTSEKLGLIEPLMQHFSTLSPDKDWAHRHRILEIIDKHYDPLIINYLVNQILSQHGPNLYLIGKNAHVEVLLELSSKDERVREQSMNLISETLLSSKSELAENEITGSPCPISLASALLIEIMSQNADAIPAEIKKQQISLALDKVANQAISEKNNSKDALGKPVARTSKLDLLRAMGRFALAPLDELELTSKVLLDEKASLQTRSIAGKQILHILQDQTADPQSIALRLAQQHQLCNPKPQFPYLEILAPQSQIRNDTGEARTARKLFENSHRLACLEDE